MLSKTVLNIRGRRRESDAAVVEGMLEPDDGKVRIRPTVRPPTTLTYSAEKAETVLEAAHKPVRVTVDPKTRKLVDIEITADRALDHGLFFAAKTIDQLMTEQDVQAVTNLDSLAGAIPDEDVDEFVAAIHTNRRFQE